MPDTLLLHMRFALGKAQHYPECPKGKRRSLGIPVLRNSVVRWPADGTCKFICHAQPQGSAPGTVANRAQTNDFCRCMIHFCFKMQRDISFRKNLCYTETR